MEFLLLPTHRGDPPLEQLDVPKTPYLAIERYDGGPFLSYPARKGKDDYFRSGPWDFMEYARLERLHPINLEEKESFFQAWLYFGLIAEFMGVNSEDSNDAASKEILDTIYKEMLYEEQGKTYVKLTLETLERFLELGRARLSPDPLLRKQHYEHMVDCLSWAHQLIHTVKPEFNWRVKWAISALGELFMITLQVAFEALKVSTIFSRTWANGFLNDEVKAEMMRHAWCRSDIVRAEDKYTSIQALYIASRLDKSHSTRDHRQCTDSACNFYQIVLDEYQTRHQKLPCSCEELVIEEESLLPVLLDGDHYPLLKFSGQGEDLKCEIVKSGNNPYIALSHVWADGLGNPKANSLHKCKLNHLVETINSIADAEAVTNPDAERPLIWLDTLCCPATHALGKQKGIEKIRLVYQEAKHVLVLDASLMSYKAENQEPPEILLRIFTAGWMRRLWTLQEGALAKSLIFQFADQAVEFFEVCRQMWALMQTSIRHRALYLDFDHEFKSIEAFFNFLESLNLSESLVRVDRALQFRSVTVAADEPLCIGTLLSLDLHQILGYRTEESRMAKVWELFIAKHGGVPSQIIFFEEQKLTLPGWRWAPKSLLNFKRGVHTLNTRVLRWKDPVLALPEHPHGLRVRYNGVRLMPKQHYGDGKPLNPWIGAPRLPEDWIEYRDLDNGRWYRITSMKHAAMSKTWTDEEREHHNKQEIYILHQIVNTDRSVLILNKDSAPREALLATTVSGYSQFVEEVPVAVETQMNVMVSDLKEQSYMHDVFEKIAHQVRADEVTDKHLELCNQLGVHKNTDPAIFKDLLANDKEFIASTASVRAKIKEKLAEAVAEDKEFVRLINTHWGEAFQQDFWVTIRNFFHHDYVGRRTGDQQVWRVD